MNPCRRFSSMEPTVLTLGGAYRYIRRGSRFGAGCSLIELYDETFGKPQVRYDGCIAFEDGRRMVVTASSLIPFGDPRWPVVPVGDSCPIGDHVLNAAGDVVLRPRSALFKEWDRAESKASGGNGVHFHTLRLPSGRRVGMPSWSGKDAFAKLGVEAPRVVCEPRRMPLDMNLISALIVSMGGGYPEVSQSKEAA